MKGSVHALYSYPDNLDFPQRGTKASATASAFDLSRGYTEQQEWVWSLSSTLGREVNIEHVKNRNGRRKWERERTMGISLVLRRCHFGIVDDCSCSRRSKQHFPGIAHNQVLQPAAAALHVLEQPVHAADIELSAREQRLICSSAVFFLGGGWRE